MPLPAPNEGYLAYLRALMKTHGQLPQPKRNEWSGLFDPAGYKPPEEQAGPPPPYSNEWSWLFKK